ncbi:MAG: hypothetical protein D6743_00475 [Calditrichaeota bacterium]|nr:MAG: hypothetical protein D6743_00475 [Calditrichota bacterium]
MKELLYFSSSDLMVQVVYREVDNSLQYYSHRKLSFGERVVVEQYLLTNIAVKTSYYKKHPAAFSYSGVNTQLVKDLNQFHLKNTMKNLQEKEKDVEQAVKNLVDQSLSNYYFERIGETILRLREAAQKPLDKKKIIEYTNRLSELVEAYNAHAEETVSVYDVIPEDLRSLVL